MSNPNRFTIEAEIDPASVDLLLGEDASGKTCLRDVHGGDAIATDSPEADNRFGVLMRETVRGLPPNRDIDPDLDIPHRTLTLRNVPGDIALQVANELQSHQTLNRRRTYRVNVFPKEGPNAVGQEPNHRPSEPPTTGMGHSVRPVGAA